MELKKEYKQYVNIATQETLLHYIYEILTLLL